MSDTKGSILIVDDESQIRALLAYHFNKLNYNVHEASNGVEALKVLEGHKFDVIISDIIMPEMDGVELVRRVRIEHPMTRIIMMTGYVKIENLLICVQNQADTVIFKPFKDLSEFTNEVEKSITQLKHWRNKLAEFENFFGASPNKYE
jgi:CheY-like chemotaxis protein